jgi:hypothetical protein
MVQEGSSTRQVENDWTRRDDDERRNHTAYTSHGHAGQKLGAATGRTAADVRKAYC